MLMTWYSLEGLKKRLEAWNGTFEPKELSKY